MLLEIKRTAAFIQKLDLGFILVESVVTAGKNSVEKRFVAVDPDSVQPFERLIANQRIG